MRRHAILLLTLALACGPGGGTDSDVDGDADGDVDGDVDSDVDGDADGGGDGCSPAELVAEISADPIRETIAMLTALPERSTFARQEAAADLLVARLAGFGVTAETETYGYAGRTWRNLVVTFPGTELSGELLLAGAHYDSTSSVPSDAPGADDNASGAAGVVEIARAMAGCSYRRTVRLVLFSNEEVGTVGSTNYVSAAHSRGDDIRAFLAVDMIAYGPDDEDLDVATRPEYAWLASRVVDVSERLVGLPAVSIVNDHCG